MPEREEETAAMIEESENAFAEIPAIEEATVLTPEIEEENKGTKEALRKVVNDLTDEQYYFILGMKEAINILKSKRDSNGVTNDQIIRQMELLISNKLLDDMIDEIEKKALKYILCANLK